MVVPPRGDTGSHNAITVGVQSPGVRWQDGEVALVGDRTWRGERPPRWDARALVGIRRIMPGPVPCNGIREVGSPTRVNRGSTFFQLGGDGGRHIDEEHGGFRRGRIELHQVGVRNAVGLLGDRLVPGSATLGLP